MRSRLSWKVVYQYDATSTNNNESNNKGTSSSNHEESDIEADQQTTSPHKEADRNCYLGASLVLCLF